MYALLPFSSASILIQPLMGWFWLQPSSHVQSRLLVFWTWNFRTMYTTNVNNSIFYNTRYNPYVPRLGYAEHAIFSLKVFAVWICQQYGNCGHLRHLWKLDSLCEPILQVAKPLRERILRCLVDDVCFLSLERMYRRQLQPRIIVWWWFIIWLWYVRLLFAMVLYLYCTRGLVMIYKLHTVLSNVSYTQNPR